jgi:uncharacterized damage-inducible protein DinB
MRHVLKTDIQGVPMSVTQAFLAEFEQEAKTTRRVLERVPTDKLSWKPHPKSMSLGHLALHVAMSPAVICGWAKDDVTEFGSTRAPDPTTTEEIVAAHDQSVATVKQILSSLTDEDMTKNWQAKAKDAPAPMMTMPKIGLLRSLGFNHTYHHRGQLSVYLRLLDVPVPSIYGPSADENPFAART